MTNFRHTFENAATFVGTDIGTWDVSHATDMFKMFAHTKHMNVPLADWDTSAVTNMQEMFRNSNFNNDLSSWNVARVTTFAYMFHQARLFTGGDLSKWKLQEATNLNDMFNNADVFNGNVTGWLRANTKVTTMSYMFHRCFLFTGVGIPTWNTGTVSILQGLFDHNYVFNADVSGWDVSGSTTMVAMFRGAKIFNADLSLVGLYFFSCFL